MTIAFKSDKVTSERYILFHTSFVICVLIHSQGNVKRTSSIYPVSSQAFGPWVLRVVAGFRPMIVQGILI